MKIPCNLGGSVLYFHIAIEPFEEVSDLPNIKSASKRDALSKLQNAANKERPADVWNGHENAFARTNFLSDVFIAGQGFRADLSR